MATIYSNFNFGTLSAAITNTTTVLSSDAFASLPTIASPDILYLILDPRQIGGAAEIVTVTTHTAASTSATVTRGSQSTTARAHNSATTWAHGVTSIDMQGSNPVGVIVTFAGSTAPIGWLLCDGTAISRTTYFHLFNTISTTYGTGDGSTTFNIPNLKGRIPVGRDSAQTEFDVLGETGGAKTHTLAESEIPSHSHGNIVGWNTGTGAYPYWDGLSNKALYGLPSNTNVTGGGGAHNNLQPYLVINYIIRAF